MRIVQWEDESGRLHLSKIRNDDADSMAKYGVPCDPPDVREMDWEMIKRELHNELVRRRITNWQEAQKSPGGLPAVIQTVLKRRLIGFFKQEFKKEKEARRK